MRDFINSRLNKDNFWNVMFFATFFTGLSLGNIMPQPFGGIVFWLSPLAAVFLVKHNTQLTFDKKTLEFITSQGTKIQKIGLMFFWLLFSSFFLSAGLTGLISKTTDLNLFFFFFTLFPALYCILRNFPISVYFKKEAWIGNGKTTYGSIGSSNRFHNTDVNTHNNRSIVTDPSYRYLSCNIYNKR